ncbi:MAG: alpha-galactosidase [Planctomycetaceae bacterium]|jgi:hypothetical protein|nr:alpha-galactosidase [Planctomycetaceae bacterium]
MLRPLWICVLLISSGISAAEDSLQNTPKNYAAVTNGKTTVIWNAEKFQVEIADKTGVYAVMPFPECSSVKAANDSNGRSLLLYYPPHPQNPRLRDQFLMVILPEESSRYSRGEGVRIAVNYGRNETHEVYRFPSIELQLPQKADQLRSFGTAGLKPVDGHKGSYMFLSIVDPQTRNGVVSGWTTAGKASGIVYSEKTEDGQVRIIPESQHGKATVSAQPHHLSEFFFLGRFDDCRDGLEIYADAVAALTDVRLKPLPAGYCTWYSNKYGGACDETHLRELAEAAGKLLQPYGLSFIQIDDKWQTGVQTNGPKKNFTTHDPKGPYPNGMKPSAEMLKNLGLTAGIWFMPFAGNINDPHFPKEWYVKSAVTDEVDGNGKSKVHQGGLAQKEGEPYESSWGGTSLDMTNPEVQQYLADEVQRINGEWGYDYFKLDGLWTGMACDQLYVNNEYKPDDLGKVRFFDEEHYTPLAAYRKGFEIIRDAAPDVFILGCNVSQNMRMMHPSIGYVDAMRIGPDNGSGWNSLKTGPWHGSNRYFLNGRVWWNDPDPVYVRESMPIEHARLIASWVAVSGQLYTFSDWLPDLPPERVEILRRTIRPHGLTSARPVDLFNEDLAKIWHLHKPKKDHSPARDIAAFYNWDDKKATKIETTPERLGLPKAEEYAAFDFWGNKFFGTFTDRINVELPPGSCLVLAVRPVEDHPILLSTSQHVTQGIVDVVEEKWNPVTKALSGVSRTIAEDPYELRIYDPVKKELRREVLKPSEADAAQSTWKIAF